MARKQPRYPAFPASLKLIDTAPPPTLQSLADFQQLAGAPLPDDYRRFLLKYNGGNCDPWLMLNQALVVASFYGIREEADSLSLAAAIERGRTPDDDNPFAQGQPTPPPLPEEVIPIGENPEAHGIFCLVLSGAVAGSVWFCDTGADPAPAYDGSFATAAHMVKAAASFREFLNGLVPYEHREAELEGLDKILAADDALAFASYLDAGHTDVRSGTPLTYRAAMRNATACFRLLLDRGASGREALKDACSFGRIEMVRILLSRGEQPKLFHRIAAAGGNHPDIVRLLDQAMSPKP